MIKLQREIRPGETENTIQFAFPQLPRYKAIFQNTDFGYYEVASIAQTQTIKAITQNAEPPQLPPLNASAPTDTCDNRDGGRRVSRIKATHYSDPIGMDALGNVMLISEFEKKHSLPSLKEGPKAMESFKLRAATRDGALTSVKKNRNKMIAEKWTPLGPRKIEITNEGFNVPKGMLLPALKNPNQIQKEIFERESVGMLGDLSNNNKQDPFLTQPRSYLYVNPGVGGAGSTSHGPTAERHLELIQSLSDVARTAWADARSHKLEIFARVRDALPDIREYLMPGKTAAEKAFSHAGELFEAAVEKEHEEESTDSDEERYGLAASSKGRKSLATGLPTIGSPGTTSGEDYAKKDAKYQAKFNKGLLGVSNASEVSSTNPYANNLSQQDSEFTEAVSSQIIPAPPPIKTDDAQSNINKQGTISAEEVSMRAALTDQKRQYQMRQMFEENDATTKKKKNILERLADLPIVLEHVGGPDDENKKEFQDDSTMDRPIPERERRLKRRQEYIQKLVKNVGIFYSTTKIATVVTWLVRKPPMIKSLHQMADPKTYEHGEYVFSREKSLNFVENYLDIPDAKKFFDWFRGDCQTLSEILEDRNSKILNLCNRSYDIIMRQLQLVRELKQANEVLQVPPQDQVIERQERRRLAKLAKSEAERLLNIRTFYRSASIVKPDDDDRQAQLDEHGNIIFEDKDGNMIVDSRELDDQGRMTRVKNRDSRDTDTESGSDDEDGPNQEDGRISKKDGRDSESESEDDENGRDTNGQNKNDNKQDNDEEEDENDNEEDKLSSELEDDTPTASDASTPKSDADEEVDEDDETEEQKVKRLEKEAKKKAKELYEMSDDRGKMKQIDLSILQEGDEKKDDPRILEPKLLRRIQEITLDEKDSDDEDPTLGGRSQQAEFFTSRTSSKTGSKQRSGSKDNLNSRSGTNSQQNSSQSQLVQQESKDKEKKSNSDSEEDSDEDEDLKIYRPMIHPESGKEQFAAPAGIQDLLEQGTQLEIAQEQKLTDFCRGALFKIDEDVSHMKSGNKKGNSKNRTKIKNNPGALPNRKNQLSKNSNASSDASRDKINSVRQKLEQNLLQTQTKVNMKEGMRRKTLNADFLVGNDNDIADFRQALENMAKPEDYETEEEEGNVNTAGGGGGKGGSGSKKRAAAAAKKKLIGKSKSEIKGSPYKLPFLKKNFKPVIDAKKSDQQVTKDILTVTRVANETVHYNAIADAHPSAVSMPTAGKKLSLYKKWNPHLDANPRHLLSTIARTYFPCPLFHGMLLSGDEYNRSTVVSVRTDSKLKLQQESDKKSMDLGSASKASNATQKGTIGFRDDDTGNTLPYNPETAKNAGVLCRERLDSAYMTEVLRAVDPFLKIFSDLVRDIAVKLIRIEDRNVAFNLISIAVSDPAFFEFQPVSRTEQAKLIWLLAICKLASMYERDQ